MSWAAHNVEYIEEYAMKMAMRGDFGIGIQWLAEDGEVDGFELFYKLLTEKQRDTVMLESHRAWAEDVMEDADSRRKQEREDALFRR